MQIRRNVIPEASVITDFAITTVNIPDRLDAQEVRAREESETDAPHSLGGSVRSVRRWAIRGFLVVAACAIAFGAYRTLAPLWSLASAEGIAARLTAAVGRPVRVSSAGVRFAPTPRLLIEGIDFGNELRIDSVALRFNWSSLARYVQGAGWAWGEATVGPLELAPEGAFVLMRAAPALSTVVPAPIRSIRFESVRLRDTPLLPARYQVAAERAAGNAFSELTMTELDGDSLMEVSMVLQPSGPTAFRLHGLRWRPPLGPLYAWHEVAAEGSFDSEKLQIDNFSANGFLGVVSGSLIATRSADWTVRGTAHSTNVDLAAIQRDLLKRSNPGTGARTAPALQGVLEANGALSGQGKTLADALQQVSVTGRVQVRFAALNGVNLGASAVRGSDGIQAVGATRFGELAATATVSRGTVRFTDIVGTAGALRVTGAVGVGPDLRLGGVLRAVVSSAGGPAPTDFRISGTVFEPVYER